MDISDGCLLIISEGFIHVWDQFICMCVLLTDEAVYVCVGGRGLRLSITLSAPSILRMAGWTGGSHRCFSHSVVKLSAELKPTTETKLEKSSMWKISPKSELKSKVLMMK